ncbi:hypothetical protein [Roseovarius sp. D22-M7]|uniref:hypothetical protein n=1 Tax=Roseovarius sp. D22-M7 TaxID=3127116 RepID=UPI00300F98DC
MKIPASCLALAAALVLSACATPKQQCINDATQQLRSTENALATAQGNISRGYALHSQSVPYTVSHTCYRQYPHTNTVIPYSCPSTHYRTQTTPVAIDVAEERRKAARYREILPGLREAAAARIAQCNAQFPE